MDFLVAGVAAGCAGFFTNPLEVIKIRLQLQGELQEKGKHAVHYRNSLHGAYQIAKHDGYIALQNGLVPAVWTQLIMNGSRLGGFQLCDNKNLLRDKHGNIIFYKAAFYSGVFGIIGHYLSNPFYLIKTRRQSLAAKAIAVGHQHKHEPLVIALKNIFKVEGIYGLFRGGIAVIPRAFVASSSQLLSFSYAKEWLNKYPYFKQRKFLTSFCGSLVGGIAISTLVTPFDLILIRLYNQEIGTGGKGVTYTGYFDCIKKVYQTEGVRAFYKGIGPMYLRLGPHSVLTLVFWDVGKAIEEKAHNAFMKSSA